MNARLACLALLLLGACSGSDEKEPEEKPDAGSLPAGVCRSGASWKPGQKAFREATAEWGLEGVRGARLSAADFDGDGWPDLVVRGVGVRSEDFDEPSTRFTFVMRNAQGRFEDVTRSSGLLQTRGLEENRGRPTEVWSFADVDNDGDLDVFTGVGTSDSSLSLGETSELLFNQGDGTFTLGPVDSPLRRTGAIDSTASASFVDFDQDGLLDLWNPQHGHGSTYVQDRLWKGSGEGLFVDVSETAGVKTLGWSQIAAINEGRAHSRAWAGNACDLNGDGLPELLTASYGRAPNHLWQAYRQNDGSVGYYNRSLESGYAFDDNQAWEDNQFAACFCKSNPTAAGCGVVAEPLIACTQANWNHAQDRQPFRLGGNSSTTVCADLDGDGDLDLVTSEIRHWWAGENSDKAEILVNSGESEVRLTRPGREATGLEIEHVTEGGWDEGIMTAAVFDFDGDGRPDVYLGASDYAGNRGLLFHQSSTPLVFEPVSVEDAFEHNRSHGVVIADFDRDGDEDLIVGHSRSRCDASSPNDCYPTTQVRAFENLAGDGANFLQLRLEGRGGSNRSAIGARVTVTAGGRSQTKEVRGGYGHFGQQDDLLLTFGLGEACEAEVIVRWPDALRSVEVHTLGAGHRYQLVQNESVSVLEP